MTGWLIVNSFIHSAKFSELYRMFRASAEKNGVEIEIKKSSSVLHCTGAFPEEAGRPDFVIFWDKDIYLARELEMAGLRVFNSSRSIELCDNKIKTALSLSGKVPCPETIAAPKTFEGVGYNDLSFLERAGALLHYPMIIKEAYGSFGQQVYLAKNEEDAVAIVKKIGHKDFLMQKYIANSHGRDVRICVIGNRVAASMLRCNPNDFRSNITGGGQMLPCSPDEEQSRVAIAACQALGLDFAGVDVLFGENDQPLICEVNSNPHFRSTFDCTGIDLSDLILKYILRKIS